MKDFIRQRLNENFRLKDTEFRFNDGKLIKQGHNSIYMDDLFQKLILYLAV